MPHSSAISAVLSECQITCTRATTLPNLTGRASCSIERHIRRSTTPILFLACTKRRSRVRRQNRAGLLAEQVKGKASDVADRASGVLTSAQEKGSEAASNAGEVVSKLREALMQSARTQPGTTVLLSIAAGFMLGAMWKSGR